MSSSIRKKERRHQRYLRNVKKEQEHKEEAWNRGKLIEPNHNGGPYPSAYSIELGNRLYERMISFKKRCIDENLGNDWYITKFRLYRMKIRDFILHFSPEIPKTPEYEYLKGLIETYWDEPENLLNYE